MQILSINRLQISVPHFSFTTFQSNTTLLFAKNFMQTQLSGRI